MSGLVPIDQDARDRIIGEVDRSLLIEAGAGTGKTTVLVERIVQALRTGVATADDIAVVTFTEKAATELSTRVREGLEAALREAKDPDEQTRLRRGARDLYRARVETLHAFATSLLRERPVEARVDPRFSPLDDVAASLLFDEVYEQWLGDILSREDPGLERAIRHGLGLRELRSAAEIVDAHREALPLKPFAVPEPDVQAFLGEAEKAREALVTLCPRCVEEEDRGLRQLEDRLLPFLERLKASHNGEEAEALILFRWPHVSKSAGTQKNWQTPDDCRAMKEIVKGLIESADALRDALRASALADVLDLVQEFVARHTARRRADGVADFDDMLGWARDLLRDDLEVRRYFQRRYRAVLIDEFQDTDPVQAEIALYLTSDGQDSTDWRKLRPVPGKLVVVGDPKQSIYRFRKADIAIYDAVKGGALDGELEQIRQNFRSVGDVLAFANRVFEDLFGEGKVGVQAPHVALEPAWPDRVDDRRCAVVVVHGDGEGGNAAEVRKQEFERLSALIERAVREERWIVRDGEDTRAAEFGDVTILVPRRTDLDVLCEALDFRRIPYRADAPGGFFGSAEVRDLIHVLWAVDDPGDRLSVFAALRSRAFACSDEEVVLHTAAGGTLNYRVPPPEDTPPAVAEALEVLRTLHRERRGLSVAELVRRVLDTTGMVELALDQGAAGAQGAANLLRVVERARSFQAAGGGGLRSFTGWLDERLDGADRNETEAVTLEEGDEAVRIMTIHGAKGLEFPIAVVANLNTKPDTRRHTISRPELHELHFQAGNKDSGFATPGYADQRQQERQMLDAEEQRLLYVALTRAKDHLVIPFTPPRGESSGMLALLESHLPDADDDIVGTDVEGIHVYDTGLFDDAPKPEVVRAPKARKGEIDSADAALDAWARERADALRHAATELPIITASSVEPPDRVRPLVAVADAADEPVDVAFGPPLEVGNAVHLALERVSLPDPDDLDEVVAAACAEAGLVGVEGDLADLVRAGIASPTVQRAIASGRYLREVPFTVPASDGEGYVTGRMDLVFEDEDGELVVVDYKTDQVGEDEAALDIAVAGHAGQVAAYATSVGQATGRTVKEVVLVFVRRAAESVAWSRA